MGFLRIILALTVVIAHSDSLFGFTFTGSLVAVETFFIISGFYMAMILDKKYIGKGSYTLFLSNRFLRLYPILWVVLLLTLIASFASFVFTGNWFRLSLYIKYFDIMSIKALLFQIITNVALFGQDIVMFLGISQETGEMYFTHDFRTSQPMFYHFLFVPQAWSLGIEVTFYLIAPFIVRKSNLFIALLIILSMSIRIFTYLFLGFTHDPWTYRFFPSELALFLLGTVSYRLYKVYKIHKITIFGYKIEKIITGIFFIVLIFYQFVPHMINWIFYALCCLSIPFLFDLSKSSKFDSRIGELSYPIYVIHILVIGSISPFFSVIGLWDNHKGEWSIIITILVSYILVRLISDPIEMVRQSRVKKIEQKA